MASKQNDKVGAVLVVGGGIGGVQASLDLADSGFKVHLVESSPAIGGVMAQLDKTFPTNDCSLCILSPKLVECGRHRNIDVITNAEVAALEGEPGNFEVTVSKKPRYIDVEKCTGCGLCAQHCPIRAIDVYNERLTLRHAAYVEYPQAVPLAYAIDRERCIGCGLCASICLAKAVRFDDSEQTERLDVGAVILAPGFDEFNATLKGEYGYGVYPNVVTSIEFERILSASGPYDGHVYRPGDGDVPERIAFIQCVGSRDTKCDNTYCSSVCCTYAIKEAVIAKEHIVGEVDTSIFFMDMRTYAKGFEEYYQRAEKEHGVRFIRSRVSSVEEIPDTGNLRIRYETEDGTSTEEEFDLVVLSVGLEPSEGARRLADTLGLDLNRHGFCETSTFAPLETSRPGVFVCGAFGGPVDIPETVAQASGAVARAAGLLAPVRGTMTAAKTYPEEVDVYGQEPRVGVFVCNCGINIGGTVDVEGVAEYARTLGNVAYVETNLYTCSQDTQEKIRQVMREQNLNRVIVAACTPRTHEPLFQETLQDAGLNRYLFEMTNIRDQCSWVHMHEPDRATEKAKDLVRMAVAKARLIEPLEEMSLDLVKRGLVIGGGLAGMTAALNLAEQGFECTLVEREAELGGNLRNRYYTLTGEDVAAYLRDLVGKVESSPLIQVRTGAEIEEIQGFVGNFAATLVSNGDREEIEHGAIIVATGAEELRPSEYLYGEDDRVLTQGELEKRLGEADAETRRRGDAETVVMIQCVGGRNEERPYCSRICCSQAIKNALKIKEMNPKAEVYILYKDMRTYGFREDQYREAREQGVLFVRYDDETAPEVSLDDGRLRVVAYDPILGEQLALAPDLLVLSAAIVPRENESLAKQLKVPLTGDGFFLEAHVKLRPVDFATDGIFLCGMAHSPKGIEETIAQANGSAARAGILLSKDAVTVMPTISEVDEDECIGCGLCESLCEFNSIRVEQTDAGRVARTIAASCKGCGTCAASCPQRAISMRGFTDEQLLAQVRAMAGAA